MLARQWLLVLYFLLSAGWLAACGATLASYYSQHSYIAIYIYIYIARTTQLANIHHLTQYIHTMHAARASDDERDGIQHRYIDYHQASQLLPVRSVEASEDSQLVVATYIHAICDHDVNAYVRTSYGDTRLIALAPLTSQPACLPGGWLTFFCSLGISVLLIYMMYVCRYQYRPYMQARPCQPCQHQPSLWVRWLVALS